MHCQQASWPPSSSRWKTNRAYDGRPNRAFTPCCQCWCTACTRACAVPSGAPACIEKRVDAFGDTRPKTAKGCMHVRLAQMANQHHASRSPLAGIPGTRENSLQGDGKDRGRVVGTGLQVL